MIFTAKIQVNFKPGINDPQAISVYNAIHNLGFNEISNLFSGKLFSFQIESNTKSKAKSRCIEICDKLLANPVIENYEIELV